VCNKIEIATFLYALRRAFHPDIGGTQYRGRAADKKFNLV